MLCNPNRGVSLVETVMALAISILVVSIFTPMVLKSRDKMREVECANNLRRIGEGWLLHEQAQNHLPSSGWGWRWTGDPTRGFGKEQPGGWAYDAIRFTEFEQIATAGAAGLSDTDILEGKIRANGHPIPFFYCPSRRGVRAYPWAKNSFFNLVPPRRFNLARIDYSANCGNINLFETSGSSADADTPPPLDPRFRESNGVTTQLSQVRIAQVSDGLSRTLMVAEKYLNPNNYLNGEDNSDDGSAYIGIDRDLNSYTATVISTPNGPTPNLEFLPRRDREGLNLRSFGSAHKRGFNAMFCDQSVRHLSYDIDYLVFHAMGARNDRQ